MVSPTLAGVFRSLRLYRGDDARHAAMDRLHARFLGAGDLAFDVGAHVGDRIASFRRLGARVVALEPQPLCHRALRLLHGRDPGVTLLRASASSTVSSWSSAWCAVSSAAARTSRAAASSSR